jgi:hypothetical protein
MKPMAVLLFVSTFVLGTVWAAYARHAGMDDNDLMTRLKAAAPAHVLEHATIMSMGADGKMKVIQEGNNGWTCMDPGGAPMCADKGAMEWAQAWQTKGPAPQKLGFIYMLARVEFGGERGAAYAQGDGNATSKGLSVGQPASLQHRRFAAGTSRNSCADRPFAARAIFLFVATAPRSGLRIGQRSMSEVCAILPETYQRRRHCAC